MVVMYETGWHVMEVADKRKTEGIIEMPTTITDPPEIGRVKVASEIDKQRSKWNVGTVARRATKRASVGKSAPI